RRRGHGPRALRAAVRRHRGALRQFPVVRRGLGRVRPGRGGVAAPMRRSTPCAPARGAIRTVALLLGWLWVVATVGTCGRSGADPQHTSTRPERIVSQVVTSDEILWELGDEVRARVAGVSIMADDPTYSGVANSWPSSVPRVPGTSEALVAARPDLVIVASFTSPETRALLERSG